MKYIVVLGDGMADFPNDVFGNKTPLDVADKKEIDRLVSVSEVGLCKTVPDGMKAGSDIANLSVLGYEPQKCYTGRSPLEAASIGINLSDTDVTARANLVTLSDEENYEDKTMIDYSAGEITTEEAKVLIDYLAKELNNEKYELCAGVSYRHCFVTHNGKIAGDLTPPHDITKKPVKGHLPQSETGKVYLEIMKKSSELLKNHPINLKRISEGKNPATSLWFWGEGTKPALKPFKELTGLDGAMISAVDLLKGIGKLAGMKVIEVEGATGNYDTNFIGKAEACLSALKNGCDYVYIHMEAPDECGHHADAKHKVYSIEQISEVVVRRIVDELTKQNQEFSMLIMPDHPTPLATMTHSAEPVPFMIYRSGKDIGNGANKYCESQAKKTGLTINSGNELMKRFLQLS